MRYFAFIFGLFLLFFVACKKDDTSNPVQPTHNDNFVLPDSSGTISASVGDTIQIKILNTASDGGYWWYVTTNFDSTISTLISFNTENTGSPEIIGGPTNEIWLYKVVHAGATSLTMKLYRSWEPDTIISTKTFNLIIN